MAKSRSGEGAEVLGSILLLLFKATLIFLMIATPLLGGWVASSLAAYNRSSLQFTLLFGLLLFPVGPALWELWAAFRRRSAEVRSRARGVAPPEPILRASDRFILRSLLLNGTFLGLLLWSRPELAFVALSTRGDWMLDGRSDPQTESTRRLLFSTAQHLEWLYRLAHKNPFQEPTPSPSPTPSPAPSPAPSPVPSASPSPSPSPSSSSSVAPVPSPSSPSPVSLAWPVEGGLHPLVTAIPPEIEGNIGAMGAYIQRRVDDPLERIRVVHDYVADRIAYDAVAYVEGRYPPQDAETVMRTRKGVCAGYAMLFVALGKAAGLDAVYVVGVTRTQDGTLAGQGHAWNAVRAGQRWYLVDTTWDSGSVSGKEFTKNFRTSYLMTPPEYFGYTHLPDEEKWQLRERPLNRGEFLRQPMLTPSFFAEGLTLITPDRSQVDVQGELKMRLTSTKGRFVLASHAPTGGASAGEHCEVKGEETLDVVCKFGAPGAYNVNLFAGPQRHGTFHYVGKVQVNAR